MAKVRNQGVVARQAAQMQAGDTAQPNEENSPKTISEYIFAYREQLAMALPDASDPERFARIALTALTSNKKLRACSKSSFMGALLTSAQLGLEPNTPLGQAYLIPYYNNEANAFECQFQIGYKGLLTLAYRAGTVRNVQARSVYEKDFFDFSFGSDQFLRHRPATGDRGKPAYYWASYNTPDGVFTFEVMSHYEVMQHANAFSKSFSKGDSPWRKNFDEMAKKTVLKRLLKLAPLSAEAALAVATDTTVRNLVMPENRGEAPVIDTDHSLTPPDDGPGMWDAPHVVPMDGARDAPYLEPVQGTLVDPQTGEVVQG